MNKLDGIKAGDRVRVTFEGVVKATDFSGITFSFKNESLVTFVCDLDALDYVNFEKIEPPIAVGDWVTWGNGRMSYEVVAIRGNNAIVWDRAFSSVQPLSILIRVNP